MSSQTNTASGGVALTLDGEFGEKLNLNNGAPPPPRCHERGAAPPQRQRERHRGRADEGVEDDYRERFVRAYKRLRDELVSDDSCELTDEAKRWAARVRVRSCL
jgi:farnesyl diphosphate synthase